MTTNGTPPDTIVLIHGFWVTPRSWEDWITHYYENKGSRVVAPAYPGFEVMPTKVQRSNAKHYKSDAITEIIEYDGPHLMPSSPGWQEIADHAFAWALEKAQVWAGRRALASA
jgi:hypothetical protein